MQCVNVAVQALNEFFIIELVAVKNEIRSRLVCLRYFVAIFDV
jgi:hypothetical protein